MAARPRNACPECGQLKTATAAFCRPCSTHKPRPQYRRTWPARSAWAAAQREGYALVEQDQRARAARGSE